MKRSIPGCLALVLLAPGAGAADDATLELGRQAYQSCVACHGPDGKGVQAGALRMAPSLHESEFLQGGHSELITAVVLEGIEKQGNDYVQAMLPLEEALDDEQIAALITYVSDAFGDERLTPSPDQVAAWRERHADRERPWTRKELQSMLEAASEPKLLTDLTYSLYEGKWEELPDFSKLEPVATGELGDGLVSLVPSRDVDPGFGMVFEGTLHIDHAEEYRFSLTSDDGSALAIDGETVLGNDGIHPARTRRMKERLEPGVHTLKVLYFDGGGQRFLSLNIRGSKMGRVWLSTTRSEQKAQQQALDPIRLEPRNPGEAIVHRAFLPDAGPRAIAVGYPDHVNLVWDAGVLNLAYVYRGDFMDVARHWDGRGSGSKPLGRDRVLVAPGFPVQILETLDEPWEAFRHDTIPYERDTADPEKEITFDVEHPDYQFRGYRLDENRFPTFRYDFRDLAVTDRFEPRGIDGVTSLVRTLTFEGKAPEDAWFRAAANGSQKAGDGWRDVGSGLKIRIRGGEPVVREIDGRAETLVPVPGGGTITVTYRWDDPLRP